MPREIIKYVFGTYNDSGVMTRPADTTPYASGDVIQTTTDAGTCFPWVFSDCVASTGGTGRILSVDMWTNNPAMTTSNARLILWNVTPTLSADNASITWVEAEFPGVISVFPLVATLQGVASSGSHHSTNNDVDAAASVNSYFRCAESSRALYGMLHLGGAYTPTSGQTFRLRLTIGHQT